MPQSNYWPFRQGNVVENIGCPEEASFLEKQLGDMEGEVEELKMELAAIRNEPTDLLFRTSAAKQFVSNTEQLVTQAEKDNDPKNKLREDGYNKFPEISILRGELIKAKNAADQERTEKEKYESKLKDLEFKLNHICTSEMITAMKEPPKQDEEISHLKKQLRDMKEETEEIKITLNEKDEQLQDYRLKYLQAQQQVEELKRQLDVIEFDNKQVSDQIQIEIQKMKMQFQEKLHELSPLPDLLKGAQMQLQEAKQLQKIAEDSSLQLSNELHRVKEKLVVAVNSANQEKSEKNRLTDELKHLNMALDDKNKEVASLAKLLDEYKCKITRIEEKLRHQENRCDEKSKECAQLIKDLEEMKEETNRSLARHKERSDSTRRYMQTQISELERQLIQSRAHCRASQKDRDEIRQRMQVQINNLQENFEVVEIRLRALQSQVSALKSSYSMILGDDDDSFEQNKIVADELFYTSP